VELDVPVGNILDRAESESSEKWDLLAMAASCLAAISASSTAHLALMMATLLAIATHSLHDIRQRRLWLRKMDLLEAGKNIVRGRVMRRKRGQLWIASV
jgi:hypothetical protein